MFAHYLKHRQTQQTNGWMNARKDKKAE